MTWSDDYSADGDDREIDEYEGRNEIDGYDVETALRRGALDPEPRGQLRVVARTWAVTEAAALERIMDEMPDEPESLEDEIERAYCRIVLG